MLRKPSLTMITCITFKDWKRGTGLLCLYSYWYILVLVPGSFTDTVASSKSKKPSTGMTKDWKRGPGCIHAVTKVRHDIETLHRKPDVLQATSVTLNA